MMEKDGSTGEIAPVKAADSSQTEPQVQPLGPPTRGKKLHLAYTKPEYRTDMEPRGPDEHHATHGMLDRSLQAQIGRQLRAIFADIAEEPVPERFIKLLEALEAREKRR